MALAFGVECAHDNVRTEVIYTLSRFEPELLIRRCVDCGRDPDVTPRITAMPVIVGGDPSQDQVSA